MSDLPELSSITKHDHCQTGEVQDYDCYRQLLDFWARENLIKTNKLQVFLLTNALLVMMLQLVSAINPEAGSQLIYLTGLLDSLVWTFSIGRTSLFQEIWQIKICEIAARHPGDLRFTMHQTKSALRRASLLLRLAGAIPSKYYLIGTPVLLSLVWLYLLLSSV